MLTDFQDQEKSCQGEHPSNVLFPKEGSGESGAPRVSILCACPCGIEYWFLSGLYRVIEDDFVVPDEDEGDECSDGDDYQPEDDGNEDCAQEDSEPEAVATDGEDLEDDVEDFGGENVDDEGATSDVETQEARYVSINVMRAWQGWRTFNVATRKTARRKSSTKETKRVVRRRPMVLMKKRGVIPRFTSPEPSSQGA
jgi:hypothetical protein